MKGVHFNEAQENNNRMILNTSVLPIFGQQLTCMTEETKTVIVIIESNNRWAAVVNMCNRR
jgi:hypothetical protein